MNVNDCVHGFRVKNSTPVPEIEAVFYEMEHEKTRAKLGWLDRKDDNKSFMVAFKTIPENDTGVFHILEHSVLDGSRRYPAKSPFVQLMKNSMNTFLNAVTYPDKTVYPVSSRNEKDFENLVRVYMDATLHPMLHDCPEIFMQEGWHYEAAEGGRLVRNGVVLNEMRGVYSSVDNRLGSEVMRALFPDTCYRYIAGGDPKHIPKLTYEQFAGTHRRFYHPSNSRIFLDGSVDLEKILQILDEEYLGEFSRGKEAGEIPVQRSVPFRELFLPYGIASDESIEHRTQTAFGWIAGMYDDVVLLLALQVLAEYLTGSNDAPLKKAILEAELGQDVQAGPNKGIQQIMFTLHVKNTDRKRTEELKTVVQKTLKEIAENGVDRERALSFVNRMEFYEREQEFGMFPKGLGYGISVMESWMYGGDPVQNLSSREEFRMLRQKIGEGYLEQLIQTVLLREENSVMVCMEPKLGYDAEERRMEEQLAAVKASWAEEEQSEILQRTEKLKQWQATPDTPEAIASVPMLALSDVEKKPQYTPVAVSHEHGITTLRRSPASNGLLYLNLYFPLSGISQEELPAVSFLCKGLGQLGTENHTAEALREGLNNYVGRMGEAVVAYPALENEEGCRAFLKVNCGVLEENAGRALDYVRDILLTTKFDDRKRLREILDQEKEMQMQKFVTYGNQMGKLRAMAQVSSESAVEECTGGLLYYQWLKKQQESYETGAQELVKLLERLTRQIFTREGLTVSFTGKAEESLASEIAERFPEGCHKEPVQHYQPLGAKREGIAIPGNVSYAVTAADLKKEGIAKDGAQKVLAKMISLEYLWNRVRVQGGAYGTGFSVTNDGKVFYYSYRDPNAANSLKVYENAGDYAREALGKDVDLTGTILGTVAAQEPFLSLRMEDNVSDVRYFMGETEETLGREKEQMLNASRETLLSAAEILEAPTKQGAVCVVGEKKQLQACRLDVIYEL